MVTIEESEMSFGIYADDSVFHIEKSPQYKEKLMPNGVKTCEFILSRDRSVYFVEAKKSCPNQISEESPSEKREKYHEYIKDITDKARHSISLYASILLERHPTDGVPKCLLSKDTSQIEFKFVLVVKDAEKEWLVPLQEKLSDELSAERRIWKFSLFVLTEDVARKKRFII